MTIKIFFRKLQNYDKNLPVHYVGLNPNSLQVISGLIPNNEWLEVTKDCENIDELDVSYRLSTGGKDLSNIEVATSSELTFTNKAYLFIKDWLNDSVSAPLNGIEVRIEIDGNIMTDFCIKNDGIKYCDDDTCVIDVVLKKNDSIYTCIQTTLITDNHSGMFGGKYQHPRMAYCNELSPSWLLGIILSLATILGVIVTIIYVIIYPVLMIVYYIVKFLRKLGFKINMDEPISIGDLRNKIIDLMEDIAGCGREHPSPLIRDYISNVCSKCGVNVSGSTAPIFFDKNSPYYNLTMLNADVKKGIKNENNTDWFIPENKKISTLDMFLDELKGVFNADWYIDQNTLYFNRHDLLEPDSVVYDFISSRKKIIEGVCYTWSERKKKAYFRGGYAVDGLDNLTTRTKDRFNDIVDFNNPQNPMLEGEDNKIQSTYSMARFRGDGVEKDYISSALKYTEIITLVMARIGMFYLSPLKQRLKRSIGALVMQGDTLMNGKLLIWDGNSYNNARVQRNYKYGSQLPMANSRYNQQGYNEVYPNDEHFDDYFGTFNYIYNYDMSFDAKFMNNIFHRFYEVEDPRINPPMNKNFELKIPLCMEDMKILGLFQGQSTAIGKFVKIDGGRFYQKGKITEIQLNFDPTDKLGRNIKIKGTL